MRILCGCGKNYSVESALMYHIKNKHGGMPPMGTDAVVAQRMMNTKGHLRKKVTLKESKGSMGGNSLGLSNSMSDFNLELDDYNLSEISQVNHLMESGSKEERN